MDLFPKAHDVSAADSEAPDVSFKQVSISTMAGEILLDSQFASSTGIAEVLRQLCVVAPPKLRCKYKLLCGDEVVRDSCCVRDLPQVSLLAVQIPSLSGSFRSRTEDVMTFNDDNTASIDCRGARGTLAVKGTWKHDESNSSCIVVELGQTAAINTFYFEVVLDTQDMREVKLTFASGGVGPVWDAVGRCGAMWQLTSSTLSLQFVD